MKCPKCNNEMLVTTTSVSCRKTVDFYWCDKCGESEKVELPQVNKLHRQIVPTVLSSASNDTL